MALLAFLKYLFNDIPLDYQGPEDGWHVVPNYTRLTYSTVAGDFRLYPLGALGFVASWKDFLSCRDLAGRPLWRFDQTGRCVALAPSGQQLLSFDQETRSLVRLDARTGEVLELFLLPSTPAGDTFFPSQLLWLPDHRLLALSHDGLGVLAPDRSRWLQYHQDFPPRPEYGSYLIGMSWQPEHPDEVVLADNSGSRMLRVHLETGQVLQQVEFSYPNLYPGPLGTQTLVYTHHEYLQLNPATLAVEQRYPFAGLEGIRTEAEQLHQNSCTLWEKRALLSPGGKYLLAADHSGLLWLFDAKSGYKLRIFRRELVDYAYDMCWLDDRFFLVLLNRGRVAKIDITKLEGVFNVQDFTPDDDARHLPNTSHLPDVAHAASDEAQVRAALDTLAHSPDIAAYSAAWETIHFAHVDFPWKQVLTPAHVAGALRQYTWYLPTAGFAGLECFAELRHQLSAIQYFVPAAPLAPVLQLHDDLFERHTHRTLREEFVTEHVEAQLLTAYHTLRDWLEINEPTDVEGRFFLDTPPYQAFLAALEAAETFLGHVQGGYSYEVFNLLERAIPEHLPQYEAFLTAQQPGAQIRILDFIEYNDDPAAIDLLRRLRQTSPHADVRAFASEALSKSGRG
ncbi:hypothetical protein [Hymenobacter weizhouensis]|uniref:hypothetical protein n=1 Tax=Hymenobacter sp. YIM 151500-1 TaxID=2987689 RepID=UPI00222731F7|nr:hypothetical protein [Hymenobacter sp. YIM 151500-1]UYZ63820.1 hypothetical protein OIS53_03015 [Hymenobacter sp. YIM 151500-1]